MFDNTYNYINYQIANDFLYHNCKIKIILFSWGVHCFEEETFWSETH